MISDFQESIVCLLFIDDGGKTVSCFLESTVCLLFISSTIISICLLSTSSLPDSLNGGFCFFVWDMVVGRRGELSGLTWDKGVGSKGDFCLFVFTVTPFSMDTGIVLLKQVRRYGLSTQYVQSQKCI